MVVGRAAPEQREVRLAKTISTGRVRLVYLTDVVLAGVAIEYSRQATGVSVLSCDTATTFT